MFGMVSAVMAGSLLAASAAAMQAVFTGHETDRYLHDVEIVYDKDGNGTYEKCDSSSGNDIGTTITWTLQYRTDPDSEGSHVVDQAIALLTGIGPTPGICRILIPESSSRRSCNGVTGSSKFPTSSATMVWFP